MNLFTEQFVSSEQRVVERYATSDYCDIVCVLAMAYVRGEWLVAHEIASRAKVPIGTVRARIYQIPNLASRKCRRRGCSKEYQIRRK